MNMNMLDQAFELEAQEALPSIEDLIAEIQQNNEEAGVYARPDLDQEFVRKLLLARLHLQKETDRYKEMKQAIIAEWDKRIHKKQKDIDSIDSLLDQYVARHGKTVLDVGTISHTTHKARFVVKNEIALRTKLKELGKLDQFLKPAPLDKALYQKSVMAQLEKKAKAIAENEIKTEAEQKSKKLTKKRERQIYNDTLDNVINDYANLHMPDYIELVPEQKTLTVRSNWK
jgi:hypothetical protein